MREKFALSLFVLSSICFPAFSQKGKINDIKMLVQQWVDENNAHDANKLKELYAASVNYYTKSKPLSVCMADKTSFFEKYPAYTISVKDLDIDFFKSGIARCSFTKNEVWSSEPRKPMQGYLLFEKKSGKYLIIGESDTWTDTQENYSPTLGAKVEKSSNITYILIGGGIVVFIIGLVYTLRKRKHRSEPMLYSRTVNTDTPGTLPEFSQEELKRNNGLAFEQFVVKNFDRNYFKLLNWRGDKYIDGYYPLSNLDPDLDFIYKDTTRQESFAVECKWRQRFINGSVKLAEERKLMRYRDYQKSKGYPVFVVLGLGGTASQPEKLYIIPLNEIKSEFLSEQQLLKYNRARQGRFFLELPAVSLH